MIVATWNVNSLRARLPRVEEWIDRQHPDVLCIQETKLANDAFPALALRALGYEAVHHGQGRWNGVAIASRVGIDDVVHGFASGPDDGEARLITARCADTLVVCAYAPNGREIDHEQYDHKLRWFDRLLEHLDALSAPTDRVVLCGDLNIAPADIDVWDPAAVHGGTHVSEPERARFQALVGWGLTDVFRHEFPDETGRYTWWDYRAGHFHKNFGMRIDHILASRPLCANLSAVVVDRDARKGPSPSDHAPLVAQFAAATAGSKVP